jgi:orotidine-5'-phosphate decarboxylase
MTDPQTPDAPAPPTLPARVDATEHPTFFQQLAARCAATNSSLCVGLDPDPRRLPKPLGHGPEAVFNFCVEIVEATADFAAAFKPNMAFFESIGVEGLHVLEQVMSHIPREVPVILDAKRGDIDSTAKHYARAVFDRLGAAAVTINPYMGADSVDPFIEHRRRGVYVLCLTSNASSTEFQMPENLYLRVARKVADWNGKYGNCGMVVGATRPQYLTSIVAVAPNVPLLIPGLGAQGGDLEAMFEAAPGLPLHHLLFNVSRSILYAGSDAGFGHQARVAARYYADRIRAARERAMPPAQPAVVEETKP